jgi:spore coat protein H
MADGGSVDGGADPSEGLFAPEHVLEVEIELGAGDWEALRAETRGIFDVLGQTCLAEPAPSPFSYFSGTVRIDGDELAQVGVRKKGFFGSLSTTKPSLKLNFDEYVVDQEYAGLDKLTLNNAVSDASYIKQCLGYQLFAAAGIPAPRCNFAHVTVDGEDLGVYVHVESIDKHFLRRHFADDDGNLYEGALSDFRPGWVETFDKKTNEEDPDRDDLDALVTALDVPDGELLEALDPLIDVDRFLTFWAMEVLLMHADGYARNTNNFLVYDDPATGRFEFIPWGIDSILFPDQALPWEQVKPPDAAWAEGALAWRLYRHDAVRPQYLARLAELLDDVWDEAAIDGEIDRMKALLDGHISAVGQAAFDTAVEAVRDFVGGRRATLEAALEGPPADWDAALRAPWCIDMLGHVDGPFATTWGTLDAQDPFAAGTSTLTSTIPGYDFTDLAGGATAGTVADSGQAAIHVVVVTGAATAVLLHIETAPANLVPGATLELDWTEASGYALEIDFSVEPAAFTILGLLGGGTIHLDAAGTGDGASVTGAIDVDLYENIFF